MSMLAERRFRKKYTLTPRGKALYDDDSRLGTKMLQKMGWSKEKGLGAQEDGSKDFIRVQFKNDISGLGYENRDDQWTQHEENFNGFLKSLNSDGSENNSEQQNEVASDEERCVGFGFSTEATEKQKQKDKLKEKLSGQSLEERSKQSKARVHYKKFTRGKDLAQYSEKDLANIFGKKGNEGEKPVKADKKKQFGVIEENVNNVEEIPENPLIITAGISVSDYFKQKMDARKRQTQDNTDNETGDVAVVINQETEENKVKSKRRSEMVEPNETFENTQTSSSRKKSKKKKIKDDPEENEIVPKKKKKIETDLLIESNAEETEKTLNVAQEKETNDEVENKEGKRKKKKKSKNQDENQVNTEYVEIKSEETLIEDITTVHKKKKSKKDNYQKLSTLEDTKSTDTKNEEIPSLEIEEHCTLLLTNENEKNVSAKKKKKKSKKLELNDTNFDIKTVADEAEVNTVTSEQKVKKSKKRKSQNREMETENNAEDTNNVSCNENKECEDNGTIETLSLEELSDKCKSYNTYDLSTFCAEKFRNVNFDKFGGSNMANITGYSHGDDLELNVKYIAKDEERIMRLWNCLSTKYNDTKALYHQYITKIYKTKKLKNKQKPRLNVARFKKRNIFQGI